MHKININDNYIRTDLLYEQKNIKNTNSETYYSGEWVNLRARITELERLKSIFEKVLNA